MKVFLTILFISLTNIALAVRQEPIRSLDSVSFTSRIDSLDVVLGANKSYPEELKIIIFTTLSFFPELQSTRIKFKHTNIKTTMNVRPSLLSTIFRKKENRQYVVRIDNSPKNGKPLFGEAPFNAQVGILGHEFSHIADYIRQNTIGMGKRAISYLFIKSKARYECEIDAYTIQKGIGWQLFDWNHFVHHDSNASDKYKRFKSRVYLMPEDIMQLIYE